jgi:hypothetical protein
MSESIWQSNWLRKELRYGRLQCSVTIPP